MPQSVPHDRDAIVSCVENRLFVDVQSWAALEKSGTLEQQWQGFVSAAEECPAGIGMVLRSRPYTSRPPRNSS